MQEDSTTLLVSTLLQNCSAHHKLKIASAQTITHNAEGHIYALIYRWMKEWYESRSAGGAADFFAGASRARIASLELYIVNVFGGADVKS